MRNFAIYALGVFSGSFAMLADIHAEPLYAWLVIPMSIAAALIGKTK
jgi:hypothetical protein